MRSLFLIRHAKSSWEYPGLRDFDRPLNARGLKVAPQMAAFLKNKDIRPGLMITSPAKRALSTAQFFCEIYGLEESAITKNEMIYEALPRDILRLVSGLPPEHRSVFLFGHNPTFTEVANLYSDTFIPNVPTCGVVRIDCTADSWEAFYEGNSRVVGAWFPKEVLI